MTKRALLHLKSSDPVMAAIIEQVGPCQMSYLEPNFSTVVCSIVNQQISGAAARSVIKKLLAATGGAFTPEAILKLRVPKMRACGLSRQKVAYIRDLARLSRSGRVDFEALRHLPDHEVIARLTEVKGIGVWTAQMFLMFALRRPNVLPTGDLGVQNAIKKAYGKKRKVTPRQVERIGKGWHPHCTVATWYLWRSMGGAAEI